MNKDTIKQLETRTRQLQLSSPNNAKKFFTLIKKLERKINLLSNRTVLDNFLFRKKIDDNEVKKELSKLEKIQKKLESLDTEIERIKSMLKGFSKLINDITNIASDNISIIKNNQSYCKEYIIKIDLLISNCIDSISITVANTELTRITTELKERKESIRLLEKINKLNTNYSNHPKILNLYKKFNNIESKYNSDSISLELKQTDNEIDEIKNELETKYPPITESSDIELRSIKDWLRKLPIDKVDLYNKEYERLKNLSIQLNEKRFDIKSPSNKFSNLDRDTAILLDNLKEITAKIKAEKLNGLDDLLDELKNHFPDLDDLLTSYDDLSTQVTNAEQYRQWENQYKIFKNRFDKFVANKTGELGNILNKYIITSKEYINGIESGPCSSKISSQALSLTKEVEHLDKIRRSYKNKEMVAGLIRIKNIIRKVGNLKKAADEERIGYEEKVEELRTHAKNLDIQIEKSKLDFTKIFVHIDDEIKQTNKENGDISSALIEIEKISDGIIAIQTEFYSECELKCRLYQDKCEHIHAVFEELSIEYNIFKENKENTLENLLNYRIYFNYLNKDLAKNIKKLNKKKEDIINVINTILISSKVSGLEKEELENLKSLLKDWKGNHDDPSSLEYLQTIISEAELEIADYTEEENSVTRKINKLKEDIDKFNKEYKKKYFKEVRKQIDGMIYGAEYAIGNWESIDKQLEFVEETLLSLKVQIKRITLQEFNKNKDILELYIKKHKNNPNPDKNYKKALSMANKYNKEYFKNRLPSRLDRTKIETLLKDIS